MALSPSGNLASLHIRSMWETICDAWACWSGWNFGPNWGRIPLFWNTEHLPPQKMKIVREFKSKYRIPPNENCQRVQVQVQNTSPQMKIVRESKSEYRIPPPNENCQRVQVQVQNTLPMKIVRESKSEYRIPPQMKIVRESKSEYRIPPPKWKLSESPSPSTEYPPNENCQRVQVRVQNTPPKWKLSESKSEYRIPPQMKIVRESKS